MSVAASKRCFCGTRQSLGLAWPCWCPRWCCNCAQLCGLTTLLSGGPAGRCSLKGGPGAADAGLGGRSRAAHGHGRDQGQPVVLGRAASRCSGDERPPDQQLQHAGRGEGVPGSSELLSPSCDPSAGLLLGVLWMPDHVISSTWHWAVVSCHELSAAPPQDVARDWQQHAAAGGEHSKLLHMCIVALLTVSCPGNIQMWFHRMSCMGAACCWQAFCLLGHEGQPQQRDSLSGGLHADSLPPQSLPSGRNHSVMHSSMQAVA